MQGKSGSFLVSKIMVNAFVNWAKTKPVIIYSAVKVIIFFPIGKFPFSIPE